MDSIVPDASKASRQVGRGGHNWRDRPYVQVVMRIPGKIVAASLLLAACVAEDPAPREERGPPINAAIGDESWIAAFGEPPGPEATDLERIRTHLAHVENLLRERDVSDWRLDLRAARLENLERLRTYRLAGMFPENRPGAPRIPRFVDDDAEGVLAATGEARLCAVGYLAAQDLGEDAAFEIAAAFQHASIHEIDDDAFDAWVAGSGLTKDELAMIQPHYGFRQPVLDADGRLLPEAAARLVATRAAQVDTCVHDRLGARELHPRAVDATVTVLSTGEVSSVSVSTDLDETDLDMQRCMVTAITSTPFPRFRGKPVVAKHRFAVVTPTRTDGALNLAYVPVVFRRGQAAIKRCAEAVDPFGEGANVVVRARALPEGRFSDILVETSGSGAASSLRACAARVVSRLVLPTFKGEAQKVAHAYRVP
jgi:hypothetical protein